MENGKQFSKKLKKVLDNPFLELYNMPGFTKPINKDGKQLPERISKMKQQNREQWLLTIRTSLPNVCEDSRTLKPKAQTFNSFEEAKTAFRAITKHYAFSDNSMFDGNGRIKFFDKYIVSDVKEVVDYEDDPVLKKDFIEEYQALSNIADALSIALEGNDTVVKLPDDKNEYRWEDCYIRLCVKPNSVNLYGVDEGPCNGIDPKLKTNIFSMKRKKHYYLYIDDMFCGQNASSELYVDIKKVKTDELC